MIIDMKSGRKNIDATQKTLKFIWGYRIELALIAFIFLMIWSGMSLPLFVTAPVWLAMIAGVAGDIYKNQRRALKLLSEKVASAKVKRQLERATEHAGFDGLKVGKLIPTLPGELVAVRVPRGQTVERLSSLEREIRANMRVSDVRVIGDRMDRSRASIAVMRRDPFEAMTDLQWPLLNADSVDIRQGIPKGLDEYGRVVNARLLSRNLIMGGSPDSGKSSSLRVYAAAAALDPNAKLWMMDAKTGGAEFIHWTAAAEHVVRGRQLTEAVEMLARIEERLEKRGQEIVARGEVFVCDDMELDVLMIDELPQFTRGFEDDDKEQTAAVKSIKEGIWRLIALGRWTGMMTILSAQKPTADIVPTESRDLIDNKFALHCNTKAQSRAILGADTDDEVTADATEIPSGQPGVGYYVSDNGVQKMRSFYISPKQALEIASRVASKKLDDELAAL
jgi:S-DNA-T family DNA segregation ATPase FtsK/SpoIIIE